MGGERDKRHYYRWRGTHLNLCSALMAIENLGFLACYTYCEKGLPFIMVIFVDPWHSYLLQSIKQCSCHYLLIRLGQSWLEYAVTHWATAAVKGGGVREHDFFWQNRKINIYRQNMCRKDTMILYFIVFAQYFIFQKWIKD